MRFDFQSNDGVSHWLSPELSTLDFDPFDLQTLKAQGLVEGAADGRGSAWFVQLLQLKAVLRHYYRGGLVAKLSRDRFLWLGLPRCRAIRELQLLDWMHQRALPVPRPLGALVCKRGLHYSCDLITETLEHTHTLAAQLALNSAPEVLWRELGRVIATFHLAGVWHADLNAKNILINQKGQVFLIDFDRCRRRVGSYWMEGNLRRLKRSLLKLSHQGEIASFDPNDWQHLLASYSQALDSKP